MIAKVHKWPRYIGTGCNFKWLNNLNGYREDECEIIIQNLGKGSLIPISDNCEQR